MPEDLGFDYQTRKGSDVQILHHGRLATTLRGQPAADFLADMDGCDITDQQQIMARLTGNYKRGNERVAKNHPHNRR